MSTYRFALEPTSTEVLSISTGSIGPVGPAGAPGSRILPVTSPPESGLGNNGDYAFRSSTGDWWGPKAAGVWPAAVSLRGPEGTKGDAGPPTDLSNSAGAAATENGTAGAGTTAARAGHTHPFGYVADLKDVELSSPTIGQALIWDGTRFINQTPAGGGGGGTGGIENNDPRLSDARTPKPHAASHASGGSDPITPASIGAVALGATQLTDARNPLAGSVTQAALASSVFGTTAGSVAQGNDVRLSDTRNPKPGSVTKATLDIASITGTAADTLVVGNDARLSDQRTPGDATVTANKLHSSAFGTSAGQIPANSDPRFSDKRIPTDGSVGPTQLSSTVFGATETTVPRGNDARFSDTRTPSPGTVTVSTLATDVLALIGDGEGGSEGVPESSGIGLSEAQDLIDAHDATNGAHGFYRGTDLPAGTDLDDWVADADWLVGPIDTAGRRTVWARPKAVAEVPNTPAPAEPATSGGLDLAEQHFMAAYVDSAGKLSGTDTSSLNYADALTMAVLNADKAKYDLLLAWIQANLRRGVAGSGKTTALELHGKHHTGSAVDNWTISGTAEVQFLGATILAWNKWNRVSDRDIASKIASDIEAYLVIEDEGRAYLVDDETQKAHHVSNSSEYSLLAVPNPVIFRMAKTFTGKALWDRLVLGCYDSVRKSQLNTMSTTSGFLPEYMAYEKAGHTVGAVTNGVNGWTLTLSSTFADRARRFVSNIAADLRIFTSTDAKAYLTGAIRTKLAALWTANSKIVNEYDHAGNPIVTTESASAYRLAAEVLTADNTASSAATAMLAKVPGQTADAGGYYFPDQIVGVTAVPSRNSELLIWRITAIATGKYNDLAFLGTNPNAGTNPPATGGGTTTPDPPPVVIPPTTTDPTPTTGTEKLIAETGSQLASYTNGLSAGTKKTRLSYAVSRPSGYWVGINWDPVWAGANTVINAAAAQGAIATILLYSIPLRDLGNYSAGGASTDQQYHDHVIAGANVIGNRRVALLYEPDSLGLLREGLTPTQQAGRLANMRWAIQYLKSHCPNLTLFLDCTHANWLPVSEAVDRARAAGVEYADGLGLNVSNFGTLEANYNYGKQILAGLGMPNKGITVDVARGGNPNAAPHWANPARRRFGRFPQWGGFETEMPGLRGICDWKKPGESDGNSGDGAPNAGDLWVQYMYNDSVLSDNVDTDLVSTSSGMTQRPPTPGVAAAATR